MQVVAGVAVAVCLPAFFLFASYLLLATCLRRKPKAVYLVSRPAAVSCGKAALPLCGGQPLSVIGIGAGRVKKMTAYSTNKSTMLPAGL